MNPNDEDPVDGQVARVQRERRSDVPTTVPKRIGAATNDDIVYTLTSRSSGFERPARSPRAQGRFVAIAHDAEASAKPKTISPTAAGRRDALRSECMRPPLEKPELLCSFVATHGRTATTGFVAVRGTRR